MFGHIMRKFIYAASGLLLLFLVPARAQQQMNGTFQTYIGDRLVVTESYRATFKPDGSIATEGEITPAAGGAKQKVVTLASKTKPDSFVLEVGGVKALEAKFTDGGVVKLNAAGQPEREVQTRATVVLENLVWHQFVFLLGQYDHARGGRQNFTAFLPSQGVEYPLTIEDAPAQTYTLKDRTTVATRRYKVVAAGSLALDLWTDEARSPLLFQVESQKVRVVRQGFENLAEVAFAVPAAYKSPAYTLPAAFDAQELTVGASGAWPLPATLTMPKGAGKFPAVVLVHGSGPNDRDETLGANKPFRDLAEGLASQGIAVLRYEKRTKQHGARMVASSPNFTVKEETIDDALAAVALLRQTQGVDAKKIFVLGHSLGGMLVPRIGLADAGVAGFVIFAGATRPLEEAMVRQFEYLAALDGAVSEAERANIEDTKRQAARIKELKAGAAATASAPLLGAPPAYWLDLRDYNPPQAARSLKRPTLILQGERDFNVMMDDFRNWRAALANHKEVEFKSYPKLDHLFYEGEGAASGADYASPRNIPKYVIDDIAAWIKKQ
jgi:dienelactone hydrolase